MYGGDCQVLSTADIAASDSLIFSAQMQSSAAGLGYLHSMPFHAFPSLLPKEEDLPSVLATESAKDDEMESGGSGSANVDGFCSFGEEEVKDQQQQKQLQLPQDQTTQSAQPGDKRKKRYHRHTAHQIQEMESLFKECPHPDDKQRMKLSRDLGLSPRQVKFWFQNRRTQMKAQQDRADNAILRVENESLKSENFRLQAALRNVACPNCGGPAVLGEISFDEQHIRIENGRLKEELDRLRCIASRYTGRLPQPLGPTMPLVLPPLDLDMSIYPRHFDQQAMMNACNPQMIMPAPSIALGHATTFMGPIVSDQDKPLVLELAGTAVNEIASLCNTGCHLWLPQESAESAQIFDVEEYKKAFHWPISMKQPDVAMYTEATRDSAVVIMNAITLVDSFMDANKWMDLFPSIVSRAKMLQVISPGLSGHASGSIIMMHAELQFPSPLVPAREFVFFRYCQQNIQEGTWTIVDFPADGFDNNYAAVSTTMKCRRRPSGCIIQDMPNGYARITWGEHCELEDKPLNPTFNKFVRNGFAFGAMRWVSLLQRQCERLASLMARNVSELGVISSLEGRKNMMTLSQRMIKTFCTSVSASAAQSWTALSESPEDTIRVTTRKSTEPGQPNGMILTAVSTTWLPVNHLQVFELLTDEQRRSQIDILSSGNSLQEVAHIANGSHPRNCVSLLRINAASNSSQNVGLLIQESSTHLLGGGLVVYAAVEVDAVKAVMNGEDTSFIPLLPSGFIISPAVSTTVGLASDEQAVTPGTAPAGCLLTVGTQVLVSADLSSKISLTSVTAINNHICNTVQQISAALGLAPQQADDAGPTGSAP